MLDVRSLGTLFREEDRSNTIVALGILFLHLGFILIALQYNPTARRLPLAVASIVVIASGYLVVRNGYRAYNSTQFEHVLPTGYRIVSAAGWLVILTIVVYLFGLEIGGLLFLLGYYRLEYEATWVRTVLYAVVTWILVIVVFVFVMELRMYDGILMEIFL